MSNKISIDTTKIDDYICCICICGIYCNKTVQDGKG